MNIKNLIITSMMALSLVACGDKAQEQQDNDKPTVKIGGIFPLSGSQASQGEAAKAGMLKALSEFNKDELHYNYELVFEDNQGKLMSMPTIVNKLILQDKVDVIGTITSAMAKVIAPIADQYGVIQLVSSLEKMDYEKFSEYMFIQGIATEDLADNAFMWLENSKIDNIAVFAQNGGVIASVTAALENKLKNANIKYVINQFNSGERDFRLTIAQSKEKGFTKFFIQGFLPEKEIILKQMLEIGISKDDILGFCFDTTKTNELYEGIKSVCYNQGKQQFIDKIVSEYNLSSTYCTATFYDFINLMIDAYEHLYKEGLKPTAEEVTAYIHAKKKYKCMSGECVVKDNGFIITQPKFRICKNAKWQYVD